jgi:cardiolipin synthase
VVIRDRAFSGDLARHLRHMSEGCNRIRPQALPRWTGWKLVRSIVVFHLLRWSPMVGQWLPQRRQVLSRL